MCTENLTDQTGCPFRIQMTEPFRMDLPLQYLRNAHLTFVSWQRDTTGSTTGMKVLCDLGHGYGFDNGEKAVVLRVGKSIPLFTNTPIPPAKVVPIGKTVLFGLPFA